jgi:hypothetical protein
MVRNVLSRFSELLARAARERRQLTRGEQLSVVMFFHLGISVVALGIMLAFRAATHTPWGFFVCEGAIVIGCAIITVRVPAFQEFGRAAVGPPAARQRYRENELSGPSEGSPEVKRAEEVAGVILIAAFIVQFAALVFLLWATGGPINSPFAELTLAIAVFTPFLANDPKTIIFVVAASIVYYAGLILMFSLTHDGSSANPSVWAYFAVNVVILLGAITFTLYESLARSWQTGLGDFVELPPEKEGDPPLAES